MRYSPEQLQELSEAFEDCTTRLQELQSECIADTVNDSELVREYMHHGVGRRLSVIRHAIFNVFQDFDPSTESKLDRDALIRVQINLQAFVINVVGIFDNLAWCFVYLHDAESEVGGRLKVDMFKESIQRLLPIELQNYLKSDKTANWHTKYLKNYRDALAHRIPLYIPPSVVTPDESRRYGEIQSQLNDLILRRELDKVEELEIEQDAIGRPCFYFLHSYSEKGVVGQILIHPQMLADANAVLEFGTLFLRNWRTRA